MTTNPFRVAVVGAGPQARTRIRILKGIGGVKIVAIADTAPHRAHALGEKLGVPGFGFDSYRSLLERGELDGVIVTTPQHLQVAVSADALRREVPVLCEKPVGDELYGVPLLLSQGRGLTLATGYETPFMVPALDELTDPSRIGQVNEIAAWAIGLPADPSHPPFSSHGHGADTLADLLSLLFAITPADPVLVSATVRSPEDEPVRDLEHNNRIKATFDFPGRIRARLVVAPMASADALPETCCSPLESGILVRVSGSEGDVSIPLIGADHDRAAALEAQTRNWIEACLGREPLRAWPKAAYRIHRVMAATLTSIQLGGTTVEVEQPEL